MVFKELQKHKQNHVRDECSNRGPKKKKEKKSHRLWKKKNNKFNSYTTNIYQIWGFYSLVISECKRNVIHFYTSWFCKNTCISLLPGDLVQYSWTSQSFFSFLLLLQALLPSSHTPSPTTDRKACQQGEPFTLLQLPGELEKWERCTPQAAAVPVGARLRTPAVSTTRETQPGTPRVPTICHFSIFFCEPDILPVVKMKNESSLTFQHLNLRWYLQNSKSELQQIFLIKGSLKLGLFQRLWTNNTLAGITDVVF